MSEPLACDRCGKCCRGPMVLITKPADYRRWVEEGRGDILRCATIPPEGGYGDLLPAEGTDANYEYCPFIVKTEDGKYSCGIQETKPDVCRAFYCEWCYGEGEKGIPFKTDSGWTDRAKKLGYGQPEA